MRGELIQSALLEMRISINELISECRQQGVSDLSDVEYAILEQNGTLSLLLKEEKQPLTPDTAKGESSPTMYPVILDGCIDRELLGVLEIEEGRVHGICRKNHCRTEEVFLLLISDSNDYRLIKKQANGKTKKKRRSAS